MNLVTQIRARQLPKLRWTRADVVALLRRVAASFQKQSRHAKRNTNEQANL